MATRTLKLSYPHPDPQDVTGKNKQYRVEQVGNSVDYDPGQYLARSDVNTLCASTTWNVTIVPHKDT